ncbi:hypothetical protein QMZ92_30335 [Streptomyces sp. HNM0645]|uniref:hypothetical protein n=1 Tax=Streptomyces sp. HNM0645 TaxID=2782343 RepID=UPI0024B7BF68|nr:hypothetical protein [Streptomyces sp. HNM0645]MDI9888553.1 hypothetical protein [Streptomyces sp. HNM0645]
MAGDPPELPAKDLLTLIPEYAGLARETTLLNAEPGDPGVRESSLGGKPLWPADEAWPHCAQEDHWTFGSDPSNRNEIVPGAVPMVPILQLFARVVPGLEFPEGKDLLQLVWCALMHEQDPRLLVMPRLYWRNEAEVVAGGVLSEIPGVGEGEYDEDNMPQSSTLSPTSAEDFPGWRDLLKDMWRPGSLVSGCRRAIPGGHPTTTSSGRRSAAGPPGRSLPTGRTASADTAWSTF